MSSTQSIIIYHLKNHLKCKPFHFDGWGSRQGYITLLFEKKKRKPLTRKPLKQPKKPSGCITGTLMLTLDTYIYLQHQSLKRLSRGETELNNKKQLFYNKDFLLRVAVPNSFNMFLLGYAYFVFGEVLMSAEKKKHASHVCYILQTRVGMYFAAEGRGFCYFACLHYHSEF